MRQTFKLGTVSGVPIGMHWSVLVIMALLAQGLAMSLLPGAAPGLPGLTYWLVALGVAAVFLAALLAHESAHAVVARRYGVRVKSITLWLLGGVAQLEGEAPHARGDLFIALAGPATSLATAGLFGLGALAAGTGGASQITIAALTWLAVVNLVLAVFNMLPGAPLDGGRVLRAAAWWIKGDRVAAQRLASRAGMVVGGLLVAGGLLEVVLTASLGGIWLVLLGWFLIGAARAENLDAQLRSGLAGLKVADIMSTPAITAEQGQSVESFANSVASQHPRRAYPVLSPDGRLTGLVSLSRLARVPAAERATTQLAGVQLPASGVVTLAPDEPLAEAATKVLASGQRFGVVVNEHHVVGVVAAADITKAMELAELRSPHR
jgi:Zn-dependent protease/predicted transcriptional regulator